MFIHGGPTSSAAPSFSLSRQFWTSRGFAVVDVNYGGSTGFGTDYRRRLDGAWGVVDVDDCVAAARYLADRGDVDPARLAIRGGSAGGFTTLAAVTFHDMFGAGASHYGVVDLEALALETHKFESRYLDRLIGPYPEMADRLPRAIADPPHRALHHPAHRAPGARGRGGAARPGGEDRRRPRRQRVPHAYVPFEGEQHGFRIAANIVRALEAELWFYGRVFGFTPADPIDPVDGAVGL